MVSSAYEFERVAPQAQASSHHNFQKHTVTAIRALITYEVLENEYEDPEFYKPLECLWKCFLSIKGKKIMTKKFLYTLFCGEKSHLKNLRTYGFEHLFNKYSEMEVLGAQKELRKIAFKVFNDKNIRQHVEGRKLERKEEFLQYLLEYREK